MIDPKTNLATIERVMSDAGKPIGMREWAAHLLGGIDRAQAKDALLKILPLASDRLQGGGRSGLGTASRRGRRSSQFNRFRQGVGAAASGPQCHDQSRELRAPERHRSNRRAAQRFASRRRQAHRLVRPRRDGFQHAKPDTGHGAKLFEKHCAVCHQLGGKGAKVGPQLDGIGTRGLDRLMEDILDPNRNVDQTLRVTNLALKNGQIVSGLLLREEGEVLIVADSKGKEVRVPKSTVDERATSPMSPMPANLVDQINEGEFYDLMAYLLSKRDIPAAAVSTGGSK